MKKLNLTFTLLLFVTLVFGQQSLDDFTRADNATVGNGWTEASSDAAENASIVSNQLEITTGGTDGIDYVYQDVNALFETTYNNATGLMTWQFNMRQSRTNPSGVASGSYGVAFTLGSTNSDITLGDGYAVVLGQSGATDNVTLVSFTGGIDAAGNLTNIVAGAADFGDEHLSIRVTYNTSSNEWELFVRDDGGSFADPATLNNSHSQGTATNTDFAASDLIYLGCSFHHASGGTELGEFDNISVPNPNCTAPTTQANGFATANVLNTTLDISFTRGNGDGGVIVLAKAGGPVDTDPTSGNTYAANAAFGSGDQIGTGNFVIFNGVANGTGAATGNISISNLAEATNYHFAVYEYNTLNTCYHLVEETGNATTDCTTPTNVTNESASLGNTQTIISWTLPACSDEILVVAKSGSSVTNSPSGDGSAYTADANFGDGTDLGGSEFAVYKGTGTSVTVTGLTNGTQYFFKVFTRKATTWSAGVEVNTTPVAILFQEKFDGSKNTIMPTFSHGPEIGSTTDYYGITNKATISATFTGDEGDFFAAQDVDGSGISAPNQVGTGVDLTVTYDNIDITGATDLYMCLDMAEEDDGIMNDWEASDIVYLSADIDNSGTYKKIFQVSGSGTNTEPLLDTDCNGTHTTAITDAFTTYCVGVFGTGTTLDLRITVQGLKSGDEDIAIDNIEIYDGVAALPTAVTNFTCQGNLPVELVAFTGALRNEGVQLFWQTASEINNSHFEIQHSSDGKNFKTIGQIEGQGTTTLSSIYTFLDKNPNTGINYYRLKQMDFDGAFEFSPMIAITLEGQTSEIKLFPNPTSDVLNIELPRQWTGETLLEVYDVAGRLVQSQLVSQLQTTFNLNNIQNGQYILRAKNASEVVTKYFVKMD